MFVLKKLKKRINIKGVTLVELIVVITIMAIIVTPFIATSIGSAQNNSYAEDRMKAYEFINRTSEEIKLDRIFLESEADYFKVNEENEFRNYAKYSAENIVVKYRVDKVSTGIIAGREAGEENEFSSFLEEDYNDLQKDLLFRIANQEVIFNEEKYTVTENKFYLDINGDNGEYEYIFKNQLNNNNSSKSFNNNESNINIGIDFEEDLADIFELHIKLPDNLDREVYFYINGSENLDKNLKLINEGSKKFFTYENLAKNTINKYVNNLYKITVLVEIDGEEMDRMISYVKN